MPLRNYFWTIIIVFLNCASLFHRRNDFEAGLDLYEQTKYEQAVARFDAYYHKHPESQTTLYFLFDCYKNLNQTKNGIQTLERIVELGTIDENVYFNLFNHYQRNQLYQDMYKLLINIAPSIKPSFDRKYVLTRRLYAEIICGASTIDIYADPMVFAVSEKYLPLFPDSRFYDLDTLTNAQIIILVDKMVDPIYPDKFYRMTKIPNSSYLYLPYMRLIQLGIMAYDPDLDPTENASLITTVQLIARLKNRGIID
jgi:tetratricopeptide (TPR) repeat protein